MRPPAAAAAISERAGTARRSCRQRVAGGDLPQLVALVSVQACRDVDIVLPQAEGVAGPHRR
ncbi:MAG: hypothetical protein U1F05_02880 [Burkholderiales bacterium]